ncbi:MAG: Na+/H+ antiporter NhaA [Candidatus Heimdallarchaeota archaeon]|nr:Na+/H+ antiporter NhaA [Candidatus Heimdallarchaeota archaeon]
MAEDHYPNYPIKRNAPIARIISPFINFVKYEASSGIILIITVIVALIWANFFGRSYFQLWHTYAAISFGSFELKKPLHLWINDLLMAVFFLLVGLELKRELLVGRLRDRRRALLSVIGAMGGIIVPAFIFLLINIQSPRYRVGWAIPTSTDIAFALGILYLLGRKAPVSARVFLASLAIIDDISAILIIAFFFTEKLVLGYVLLAFSMFLILILFNYLNVRRALPYILVGSVMWYGFFGSGIHATVAGVLLAFTIPATIQMDHMEFRGKSSKLINDLLRMTNDNEIRPEELPVYMNTIASLEHSCHEMESPLQKLEHNLTPWVAFIIVPIFALANSGASFTPAVMETIFSKFSLGIILGLFIGKPIGITLFSYIAVRLGFARLPNDLNWHKIIGLGFLAGIGFTMSTFITSLAFKEDAVAIEAARIAILIASLISGLTGYFLLGGKISQPKINF